MTAEIAVAAPILMFILMAICQFALWSFATHVAQAAASSGLAVTRVHSGTEGAGETKAFQVIDDTGPGPLRNARVQATRSTTQARVVITGEASTLVPFLRLPVHAEAVGPVERFGSPAPEPSP